MQNKYILSIQYAIYIAILMSFLLIISFVEPFIWIEKQEAPQIMLAGKYLYLSVYNSIFLSIFYFVQGIIFFTDKIWLLRKTLIAIAGILIYCIPLL